MICYLVRHAKDDETVRGGWSRSPLTAEGRRQAEELADDLKRHDLGIRRVYSSDLVRALQTAQPVAQALGLTVTPAPAFREANNGELAGMDNGLAAERYPGLYWNRLGWEQAYPGGESPRAFYERICAAWNALERELAARNENALLVTHGGVIQVILSIVRREAYSNALPQRTIRHAELIALEYRRSEWRERASMR